MTVGFVILIVPFLYRVNQRVMSDTSNAITEMSMLMTSIMVLTAPIQVVGTVNGRLIVTNGRISAVSNKATT